MQRLGLLGAGHDEQELARGEQRAQPDRQRLARHALGAAEVGRGRRDGRRVQRHAAHAVAGPRAGLVEGDVRVAPQAEDGEVDRRGVEHRLVARGLGLGVGGGAVERLAAADRDAGELAIERRRGSCAGRRAPRPRYSSRPSTVDVPRWAASRRPRGARSAAYRPRGVWPVGSSTRSARARADAVGDQLGGGQPDVAGVVEDEQRRGRHGRSVALAAAAGNHGRAVVGRPLTAEWRARRMWRRHRAWQGQSMSATEPLSPLDATFLELEEADVTAHMHIGGVLVFDPLPGGGTPTLARLRRHLERRLDALPRYRQRLSSRTTGGLRWPAWEPDEQLRHRRPRHPRRAAQARRRARAARLGGRLLVAPPRPRAAAVAHRPARGPRRRALGAGHQDAPLPRGRRRLGRRGHACCSTPSRSPAAEAAARRIPRQVGGSAERAAPPGRPADGRHRGDRGRRRAPSAARRRGARLRPRAASSCSCATSSSPRPSTSLNVPLSEHRRLAVTEVPLEEIKAIKRALGGTVNDVVLALVTAGLRDLLIARGETPPAAGLRAMVPVNIRAAAEQLELGNRITSLFVHLPVVRRPSRGARYRRVRAETMRLKASHQAAGRPPARRSGRAGAARAAQRPRAVAVRDAPVQRDGDQRPGLPDHRCTRSARRCAGSSRSCRWLPSMPSRWPRCRMTARSSSASTPTVTRRRMRIASSRASRPSSTRWAWSPREPQRWRRARPPSRAKRRTVDRHGSVLVTCLSR